MGANWTEATKRNKTRRLKRAFERIGNDFSDADLSELLGLGGSAVARWRRGATLPTEANLEALEDVARDCAANPSTNPGRPAEEAVEMAVSILKALPLEERLKLIV